MRLEVKPNARPETGATSSFAVPRHHTSGFVLAAENTTDYAFEAGGGEEFTGNN
jgi:hypothetical protein